MPVSMHLGELHAYETALVVLVAFGPFVAFAGVVLWSRRRRHNAEGRRELP